MTSIAYPEFPPLSIPQTNGATVFLKKLKPATQSKHMTKMNAHMQSSTMRPAVNLSETARLKTIMNSANITMAATPNKVSNIGFKTYKPNKGSLIELRALLLFCTWDWHIKTQHFNPLRNQQLFWVKELVFGFHMSSWWERVPSGRETSDSPALNRTVSNWNGNTL
jgi:hypothetical protein